MKYSTFYDAWRIRAKYLPADSIAMVYGDKRITWRESLSRINRIAHALRDRGIKKGEKVGMLFHNNPDFSDINLAIQAIGAIPVPVNYRYVADELEFVLDNCDAVCFIYEPEAKDLTEEVKPRLSKIHTYFTTDPSPYPGSIYLDEFIKKFPDKDVKVDLTPDDIAVIIYTGGTTGRPKGVMLSYRSMLINQLSVINLLLNLLPPISQINEPHKITNTLHKKLLSFVNEMVEPTKPLLKEKNGKRPVIAIQLSGPQLPKMPTITTVMVGEEVKAFAGMPPSPDLVISMDVGEEYRALSDQNVMGATLKGKLALVPFMLKRALNGQTKITGDKTLLLRMLTAKPPQEKPPSNLLNVPPLFHLAAYAFWLTYVVHQQGTTVYPVSHSFDPIEILQLIEKEKIAWTLMVPAMWKKLVACPEVKEYNLSTVKIALSGAAVLPADTKRKMLQIFPNALVLDGFGQTEMAPVTSMKIDATPEEVKDRSVGKILDGVEVKIVDELGQEVPDGTVGELMYRAPTLMKGYYKDENGTRRVVDKDGWFRSGDLAYRGPDGEIYIKERKGECINSGGEKIFPIEVEEIIQKHPKVDMVCVVGVPDEEWGERVVAVIVPKKGEQLSAEEIMDYCTGKMAGYKKPRSVIFTDELPLSPVGKVLRAKIREFAAEKLKGA